MSETLFNSLDKPVPPVRHDLQLIPIQHNGNSVLYFHDLLGYTPPDFALHPQAEAILSLINGQFSIQQIVRLTDGQIEQEQLLEFIRLLDKNCILESDNYKITSDIKEEAFERSRVRPASLAGEVYPSDKDELNDYLNKLFSTTNKNSSANDHKKALYAPHIDPRVNQQIYADAFSSLKTTKPKRVVILATAHYTGHHVDLYNNTPFIGTDKTFELPHGSVHVDQNYYQTLTSHSKETGFTTSDRAHRIEHSIELHLLFAKHIWKHEFTIVPVLIQSFDELLYMPDGHLNQQVNRFSNLLRELDDENTFYLISGDLAHVGKKFGDRGSAASIRSEVENFDNQFLQLAHKNKPGQLFEHMQNVYDRYRICGFPPLYTFLKSFPRLKGKLIGYHWWDEHEQESAVSFGAISY